MKSWKDAQKQTLRDFLTTLKTPRRVRMVVTDMWDVYRQTIRSYQPGALQIVDKFHDFVAKLAGQGIAHQFLNTGTDVLEILDAGTKDQSDVVHYPVIT